MESYAKGETEPPLIEETIGANFERTVASYGDNEALVEFASGRRWTYAELDRDVNALARGLMGAGIAKGDRVGVWSPNCAEWTIAQYASAKIGAILVNVNPSYRTHEFSYAVNQSGLRMLISAESFKTSDYRAMVEETEDRNPDLERVVYIGTDDWDGAARRGRGAARGRRGRADGHARARRPDQHPVHERHHRLPQGRHPEPPQHPEQRLLRHRDDQLHRTRTGSASRCPSTTASGW